MGIVTSISIPDDAVIECRHRRPTDIPEYAVLLIRPIGLPMGRSAGGLEMTMDLDTLEVLHGAIGECLEARHRPVPAEAACDAGGLR